MTKTEYLEQICTNLGVDTSTLMDRLLTTYLSAIVERIGVMKDNGTLSEFLMTCANQYSAGVADGKILGKEEANESAKDEIREEVQEEFKGLNDALELILYGADKNNALDVNIEQVDADFTSIKEKIIEKGVDVAKGTKTSEYASKVDEVYAKGQAAGGSSAPVPVSDPAADAVMSLINRISDDVIGDWNSMPPDGVFIYNGSNKDKSICIIPPSTKNINLYGFFSEMSVMGSKSTLILSLPITPPIVNVPLTHDSSIPEAIYVPDESVDAYKAAENWSEFADLIKPMSDLQFIFFGVENPNTGEWLDCKAKRGMTWGEWLESDYCTEKDNFLIDMDQIAYIDFPPIASSEDKLNGTFVLLTDIIIDGESYMQP